MHPLEQAISHNGFAISNNFFVDEQIAALEKEIKALGGFDFQNQKGAVNLLRCSQRLKDLATGAEVMKVVAGVSSQAMFPVKAFVLDKTLENNWEIPWHQDLKIAVARRIGLEGYEDWSVEAGIPHVQPPPEVMSQLLTLRIHFDSCSKANAAIEVVAASHNKGIIPKDELAQVVEQGPVHSCKISKFGVMFMRPLIVHNSPLSTGVMHRRILQIEYGFELKNGLQWHDL